MSFRTRRYEQSDREKVNILLDVNKKFEKRIIDLEYKLKLKDKWIHVSQTPPEDREILLRVQVNFSQNITYHIGYYANGFYHTARHLLEPNMVTHWYPLPELYEEDKSDGRQ